MTQEIDLKQAALNYINLSRGRPALASDPGELDTLENAALTSFQGAFGAVHAPIAPVHWDTRTQFLSGTATSERVKLDVPFPCMVVGAFTWLEPIGSAGGLVVPTLNSIDVSIDLDIHEYMTNAQGTTTTVIGAQATRDMTFVNLQSVGVNGGGRLRGWVIPYRKAQIGVTFRWKQGAGVYQTSHVGITWYARALQDK